MQRELSLFHYLLCVASCQVMDVWITIQASSELVKNGLSLYEGSCVIEGISIRPYGGRLWFACPLSIPPPSFSNIPLIFLGDPLLPNSVKAWHFPGCRDWFKGGHVTLIRANQSPALGFCWSCWGRHAIFYHESLSLRLWDLSCYSVEKACLR